MQFVQERVGTRSPGSRRGLFARRKHCPAGPSSIGHAVETAVAAVFEVDMAELRAPTRGSARTAFARQVAMYLAHVVCGVSLTEVGILFGRDRTTVAHACGVVEDSRDDRALDRKLDQLERAVSALIEALSAQPAE